MDVNPVISFFPSVTSRPEREAAGGAGEAEGTNDTRVAPASPRGKGGVEESLSDRERREVEELKKRDQEVRAHEQAHLAAAGGYAAGGPRYTYKTGPDGKRYAVGGEVPIDVSEVPNNPEATLQKALTVRRAALAPANPSAADRAIAAKAANMAAKARREMAKAASESSRDLSAGSASAIKQEFSANQRGNKFVKKYAIDAYTTAHAMTTPQTELIA